MQHSVLKDGKEISFAYYSPGYLFGMQHRHNAFFLGHSKKFECDIWFFQKGYSFTDTYLYLAETSHWDSDTIFIKSILEHFAKFKFFSRNPKHEEAISLAIDQGFILL